MNLRGDYGGIRIEQPRRVTPQSALATPGTNRMKVRAAPCAPASIPSAASRGEADDALLARRLVDHTATSAPSGASISTRRSAGALDSA